MRINTLAALCAAFALAACGNPSQEVTADSTGSDYSNEVSSTEIAFADVGEQGTDNLTGVPADAETVAVMAKSAMDDSDEWTCHGC